MTSAQRVLRVLVVDDHPVVREGLQAMLRGDEQIEVVGEASDGEEAIEKALALEPDVVLTDIRMPPGISGIEVTQRIKSARPNIAVIVLTMYDSEMYVVQALRAGAAGYLLKDSSRELLTHAVKAVVDGGTMVRSGLLRQAIQGLVGKAGPLEDGQASVAGREHLTTREADVLHLVARGHTNRQIAEELHLAEVTVKKHVQSIISKLGVSDRTHAAIVAVQTGLVE